ncbi:hypothetical protein [Candidatus Methylacidithermus pantelleriae]|uniref:Uncharacterized protein n=1 Tax=Candidatus Methylacidithermus pantelleriae TaxID=2744239 RepID=A0A8J2BK77_9BACT|nr:hypothetical protein [Candidatus Methylacidithermus pantelleriae]CAF0689347.1 conserved hypothetical protein [Candidatus Methylacidithermus pantelleriae]
MAGFIGVFPENFGQNQVERFVERWLKVFQRVEQVVPGPGSGYTVELTDASEILWEEHLQFRILAAEASAWVYLSLNRRCIETTAWDTPGSAQLSLDLLVELPGLAEVIPETDQKRIEELEREGVL